MNPIRTFFVGIAPEHIPGLVAAVLLPLLVLVARRLRPPTAQTPQPSRTAVQVWVAWLLGITAVIHLALPLGHSDNWLLTAGFLGSGAGFAWLAVRAWEGRRYRLLSGLLLSATILAYLLVAGTGKEDPDQVGIVTAMVELLALGLCLVPGRTAEKPKRFKRFASSTATVLIVFIAGAWIWIGSFLSHAAANTGATSPEAAAGSVAGSGHDHGHDHAARAQAGVIMRPAGAEQPTLQQVQAADELARATRVAMARYANLSDAIKAGFVLPAVAHGPDVHMDNKANASDGRVLDPERPEKLVYAIDGGKATLLGVVFMMERAGVPGPEPGGPITRWHAHNICLSVLPPGFTIVSAYGTCPPLSITVTSAEMMHVWVVDNPGGWFAEGLDRTWALNYNAQHGIPVQPGVGQ
jgi:hypothetical protein